MYGSFWPATTDARAAHAGLQQRRLQRVAVGEEAQPLRRRPRPALLLGIFFVSLYLLTMGGHLDSPDEELMFQVTRSLVERGSMDVGATVLPEQLAQGGLDGRSYAPYGPVSSILSVPFYVLGEGLAAVLPARYAEVVERFAVGLRDPIISAAACVLFYFVALEIGFGVGVGVLLTLAFGAATLVWPYSKYAFSEPVTGFWLLVSVYAAMRAVRSSPIAWSALCGIAVGLAVGSKVTAGMALPGLFIYLVAAGGARPAIRVGRLIPFVLILVLPALALAFNNLARFGDPLDTGYHVEGVLDLSNPIGIAGLLVSPSKSLFLYAPVALLGLVGLVRLAARLPWEAGLFFWLVATHVVFHGLLLIWAGDAGWGPRYLVPILPYIVLPAGAVLAWTCGRARAMYWGSFGVLCGLGVLVNLGGVLVDQRVSFVKLFDAAGGSLVNMNDHRWDPSQSPVLIQWQEIARRSANLIQWWSQPVSLVSGTYSKETVDAIDLQAAPPSTLFPRWTTGSAVIELRNLSQPAELTLDYLDNRPSSLGPNLVEVLVDGSPLPDADITRTQSTTALPDKRFPLVIVARLDSAVIGHDVTSVGIRSKMWQPAHDAWPNPDVRILGIEIWDLHFTSNGHELKIGEALFSPMPVSDAQPWSNEVEAWFYTPSSHLADIWLWYLYLSGLPHRLLLIGLVPLAGLAWSVVGLLRLPRRRA